MIRTRTFELTSRNDLVFNETFPLYCGDLAQYQDYNPRIADLNFTVTNGVNYRTAMAGVRIFARVYRDLSGPAAFALTSRVIPFVDDIVPFFSFFAENPLGVLLPDLQGGLQLVVQVRNPDAFDWSFYGRVLFEPRHKGDRC